MTASAIMLSLKFVKLGFFCFGGGYMLIPLIISEFVGEGNLLGDTLFANLVSIAQVTPGPVGINTATFVGCIAGGPVCAAMTTGGLILPGIILGTLMVKAIDKWYATGFVRGLLHGTRLAAVALIVYAVFVFLGLSVFTAPIPFREMFDFVLRRVWTAPAVKFGISPTGIAVCTIATVLMTTRRQPLAVLILGSGILGALLYPLVG